MQEYGQSIQRNNGYSDQIMGIQRAGRRRSLRKKHHGAAMPSSGASASADVRASSLS